VDSSGLRLHAGADKFTVDMATIWACRLRLKKYGHDDGMADGTARWDHQSRMTASFKNFRTTGKYL